MKYCEDKAILDHIHRILGQIEAIQKMYTEKRTGSEMLQQVMAVRASLGSLAKSIVEAEAQGCLPSSEDQRELTHLVETLLKVS